MSILYNFKVNYDSNIINLVFHKFSFDYTLIYKIMFPAFEKIIQSGSLVPEI